MIERSPTIAGRMAMEQTARHYARAPARACHVASPSTCCCRRTSATPPNAEAMAREVGQVALFLCGPQARKISGVSFPVGGQHLTM